ncbi:MAG: hypothetical protein ACK5Y2_07260 [Bdellovibrionales bacterium]
MAAEVGHYRAALTKWSLELESLRGPEVTYQEMLVLTYRLVDVIDIFDQVAQGDRVRLRTTNPLESGSYLKMTYLLESAQTALRAGLVLVPTDRALTIRDFNYLLGTGLAPLGLSDREIFVDGSWMRPRAFFDHDIAHTLVNLVATSRVSVDWAGLIREIERWPQEEQAAAHALIFQRTHESISRFDGFILPVLRKDRETRIDEDESKPFINFLIKELKENDYWDESLLKNQASEASLRRLLWKTGEQLNASLLRPRARPW